jgi:hypothetical protein
MSDLLHGRKIQPLLLAFTFDPFASLAPAIGNLCKSLHREKAGCLFRKSSGYAIGSPTQSSTLYVDPTELIKSLADRKFEAIVIFTEPDQSPYSLAYFAYLAGIPIRVGQSQEFGGSLLSHAIKPPNERVSATAYHRHLLNSIRWLDTVSAISI